MTLTATSIKNLKPKTKDYREHDGKGLYLLVRPNGSKTWLHRIRKPKDTFVTIGQWPGISLAEARAYVANQKTKNVRAKAPIDDPETFGAVAKEWYDQNVNDWGPRYVQFIDNALERDILPVIGDKLLRDVTSRDCLDILNSVVDRGAPSIARTTRIWMSAVFKHGIHTLRCDNDSTAALKGSIKQPKVKHAVALPKQDLGRLLDAIERSRSERRTKIAIRLMALTMVRTIELRKAEWSEIDLQGRLWTIPGSKMKRGLPHIVPLSDQAIALLEEISKLSKGVYVFPHKSDPKRPSPPNSWNSAIKNVGFDNFSCHGFRATASTLLNQQGYRSDVIERQLAHSSSDKIRGVYNHADYLEERREMLQWWGNTVDKI